MQNKNFIKIIAVVFAIICVYQLSFTWVANGVEEDAVDYAANFEESEREAKEKSYLDSMNSQIVYDIKLADYTYLECKQRELNLGLDLKGGMNVTLEVMVVDVVKALSNNSKDSVFNVAIANTLKAQEDSQDDFPTLFGQEYEKLSPSNGMAVLFISQLKDKIKINATNQEVVIVLKAEVEDAISRSFNILRSRIDRFGVTQPNIQRLETAGRILVELPGIKDPERARKLLQSTAQLEFWETYEYTELFQALESANSFLRETAEVDTDDEAVTEATDSEAEVIEEVIADSTDEITDLLAQIEADTLTADSSVSRTFEEFATENPLYALLYPNVNQQTSQLNTGPVVGFCAVKDTAALNVYLKDDAIRKFFPVDVKFAYTVKPYDTDGKFVQLVALKSDRNDKPAMEGDVVTEANEQPTNGIYYEVSMEMNPEGAKQWKRLTAANCPPVSDINRSIAIVLDGYVYSYPTVQAEIAGGRSSITGSFTINEAQDLSNILKSGKLPAPARIIEEAIVGPSLGAEAISSGLISFIFALLLVLVYMIFYYKGAGIVANIALLANIFFIFGVLASFGAVLTLPGIAGIILTIGMSVDANVLIFERIREEMRNGKGLSLAITDGYNNAYSSIVDANVTTLLTGIILYTFGTGPIKGFAITLIIGILTSLFAAIFITRLVISARLNKGKTISFATKMTEGAFKNINFDFIGKRKIFYILSSIIILAGIGSLATRGLHFGVDFEGGRTYVVRFDETVDNEALRESLKDVFVDSAGLHYTPQVKTFGPENQVKITTSFMMGNNDVTTDALVEGRLCYGCKFLLPDSLFDEVSEISKKILSNSEEIEMAILKDDTLAEQIAILKKDVLANEKIIAEDKVYEQFKDKYVMSSQKVGPTIADDIKDAAVWSVFFSLLVIFLYILVRFRKWQFSLGAVAAVFHDVLIVLSIFSVLYGILPFSLEIDQAFIAAILTIIGYSLNDTVVVFDRIREYMNNNKKKGVHELINGALNSTLSRTINTSLTTFCVLLIIFIFGGEVIRGFMFALMVGVVVGTYSSLFIASPIVIDTIKKKS